MKSYGWSRWSRWYSKVQARWDYLDEDYRFVEKDDTLIELKYLETYKIVIVFVLKVKYHYLCFYL